MVERKQHSKLPDSKQPTQKLVAPDTSPSVPCFVGLIRHGERADYVGPHQTSKPYTVHHDPPLSDIGIKQAYETGLALKKLLIDEQGYETIIIECSPFIRTMMTAAHIVKGLGKGKIQINYLFTELLTPDLYEDCPLIDMLIRNLDKKRLVEDYLDGVDFEHGDFFKPQAHRLHPESRDQGKERVQHILQHFLTKYKNPTKKVAHLAVTHGFFVKQFSRALQGEIKQASFCAISAMEVSEGKGKLVFDSDCEHVKSW
ncbi:hypothetical protein FGO68_gene4205 [Halteria grandinella]|uniref:Uncharacterized protein n=1 Tax=Halteria grandinella TaxID=5974 RepID=A0A8J8NJA7_HALGN|nr:hypothetical protein FGO68_gene4205 [Halteria grandinella]